MEPLETLRKAANSAHDELSAAEVALLEATARAEKARGEAAKLDAAVAALSGEPPPEAASTPVEAPSVEDDAKTNENAGNAQDVAQKDIHDMTPEEFDAERRRKQKARQKDEQANNPLAHVKCSGCGTQGSMHESIMQAPSGMPVRMMICSSCNNQVIG